MHGMGHTARRRAQRILLVLGAGLAFAVPAAASPADSTVAADTSCVANSGGIANSGGTASVAATTVCPPPASDGGVTGHKVG